MAADHVAVGSRSERQLREGAVLRSGVLAELAALVEARGFERVVLNMAASGQHQARVQEALGPAVRVTDRVGVVLEIFKQRANSGEARLQVRSASGRSVTRKRAVRHARSCSHNVQVRLAELKYQASRLVRRRSADGKMTFGVAGQEAEVVSARGRGGQATVGGGGEKELSNQVRHMRGRAWSYWEIRQYWVVLGDRRRDSSPLLQAYRIRLERAKIERQLEEVRSRRELLRHARQRSHLRSVAIVGYTNAGKSSLLSALTGEDMGAKDELFATLDTRMRRVQLLQGRSALFADTVGFIEGLPLVLVAAFRATLEEAVHADVLVHVIDASSPRAGEQREVVHRVLASLGVSPDFMAAHMLEVWNKVDLVAGCSASDSALQLAHSGSISSRAADLLQLPGHSRGREHAGPVDREQLAYQLRRVYGDRLATAPVLLASIRNKVRGQVLRIELGRLRFRSRRDQALCAGRLKSATSGCGRAATTAAGVCECQGKLEAVTDRLI